MNKFILILVFFAAYSFDAQCQKNDAISKVYLYDGSIFIGKILDLIPNISLRIQLSDSSSLNIQYANIKKIIQIDEKGKHRINHSAYEFKETGFYNVNYATINGGSGIEGTNTLGFGLSSSFGYMFSKYFGVGLGLGVDKFELMNIRNTNPFFNNFVTSPITNTYPVFIETRGYFFGDMNSYYYSINAGFGFVNKNEDIDVKEANGGLMFHPALGIRFGGKKHFNFCLDFGVKFQKANFVIPNYFESGTDHYYINYKRFIFRVGIQI